MNRRFFIRISAIILALTAIVLLPRPERSPAVSVAVASNFADPAKAIAEAFEKDTGLTVAVSTGSTGKHYAQILNGAPFDVFLAADSKRPALLEKKDLAVPGSRFVYARGRLVLWSPDPEAFSDGAQFLAAGDFQHLALANPELAPYGSAALEVLNSLTPSSEDHWVLGENIAQTFHFVSSGAVDAGLVALSQIKPLETDRKGSIWIIPSDRYSPIDQEAILLNESPAARQFFDFLKSESARTIITSFGYEIP